MSTSSVERTSTRWRARWRLSRYMSWSAAARRWAASSPLWSRAAAEPGVEAGQCARPIDARSDICWPATTTSVLSSSPARSMTRWASSGVMSGRSTANSSPANRATRSSTRTARVSRLATSTSSASPARCPSSSLTCLNSSRSISTTEHCRPSVSTSVSRRENSVRLAMPVRASCVVWWARASREAASLRSTPPARRATRTTAATVPSTTISAGTERPWVASRATTAGVRRAAASRASRCLPPSSRGCEGSTSSRAPAGSKATAARPTRARTCIEPIHHVPAAAPCSSATSRARSATSMTMRVPASRRTTRGTGFPAPRRAATAPTSPRHSKAPTGWAPAATSVASDSSAARGRRQHEVHPDQDRTRRRRAGRHRGAPRRAAPVGCRAARSRGRPRGGRSRRAGRCRLSTRPMARKTRPGTRARRASSCERASASVTPDAGMADGMSSDRSWRGSATGRSGSVRSSWGQEGPTVR